MKVSVKLVVCSLKSVEQQPGVQNDSPLMDTQGSLDSPAVNTLGSLDFPVVNILGSLDSPVINTRVSRFPSVVGISIRKSLQNKTFW